MKDKISIEICTGTTCYVMGASDLLTIEDHIPQQYKNAVSITGSTCLGLCRDKQLKPPFVRVCGKTISMATIDKVLGAVEAEAEAYHAYDE